MERNNNREITKYYHIGPLSPFIACWNAFQTIFNEGPPEPKEIPQHTKDLLKSHYGLNCESFYNVAVVGVSGTGKVTSFSYFHMINHMLKKVVMVMSGWDK